MDQSEDKKEERLAGWNKFSSSIRPRIAIVGRTNVGKSTLFNKLAGKPISIADNTAGVTRDRKEAQGSLVDLEFVMVDCPGIEELPSNELKTRKIDLDDKEQVMRGMIEQSQYAIQYADIVLFLYDAKVGITEEDRYIANWLHRKLKLKEIEVGDKGHTVMQSNLSRNMPPKRGGQLADNDDGAEINKKYVIAIANKVETHMDAHDVIAQGYDLNLGQVVGLSCHSGDGLVDLFHSLDDAFQQMDRWRDQSISKAYLDKYGKDEQVALEEDEMYANSTQYTEEELTYIPLSKLHSLHSEHEQKLASLANADDDDEEDDMDGFIDAEAEFMANFGRNEEDLFAMKYDASKQNLDEYDSLNMIEVDDADDANLGDLDYDEINREFEAMELQKRRKHSKKTGDENNENEDDDDYLQDWELDRYNKIAQTMTDVDIDDASIGDAETLGLNGEIEELDDEKEVQERLQQRFELKLCIVGRPNVGKSSLINAILGENRCMVADIPGITRDSIAIPMHDKESGMNFKLIDTAGLLGLNKTSYEQQNEDSRLNVLVLCECLRSIRYSNIIGIVIDINEKVLNTVDYLHLPKKLVYVNNELRKLKLRNKAKQQQQAQTITEQDIEELNEVKDSDAMYDDFIDGSNEFLSSNEQNDESAEMDRLHFEAMNAAQSILNSIIDGFDRQLIEYCLGQGRGVVLVINKWDKLSMKHRMVLKLLKYSLPLVFRETGGIPVCVTSAKYKKGMQSFIRCAINIYNKWNSRVPTPILNRFIYDMQKIYPPPSIKQIRKHGRWVRYIRPKVRYMTQYTIRPPSFIAFCGTQIINDYYFYKLRRFLRNEFGLNGVPIRIKMRSNMDVNKYDDAFIEQVLKTKDKKNRKHMKRDKRRRRLRRLSLSEVLKLRKFRKDIKTFQQEQMNAEGEYGDDMKEPEVGPIDMVKVDVLREIKQKHKHDDEKYKQSMNALIEQLEMTKQEIKMNKAKNKKLTVDNFATTQRTKYRTYIPQNT